MSEESRDFVPFILKARALVSQGRIDDALKLYEDILKAAPENAAAYADRGTAYAMAKKTDLALKDLNRAIALGYSDVSIYCTLGMVYFELKNYQESLKYFRKAIEINPDYPFTYHNRANVYEALGDFNAAIADLEKCLTYGPNDALRKKLQERISQCRLQADLGRSHLLQAPLPSDESS